MQAALRESRTAINTAKAFEAVQNEIVARLMTHSPGAARSDIESRLGAAQHAETLQVLTAEDLEAIDAVILDQLKVALDAQRTEQEKAIKRLQQEPQLAFTVQAKLRDAAGNDEQAWQVVFDYGAMPRLNLALNAGFTRVSAPDKDATFGGKVAFEAEFRLTPPPKTLADLVRARPAITLSASYAGNWQNSPNEDTQKLQAKLTIPLPSLLKGLALPISVTVASKPELVDETDVRGHVGFTIDFSKLYQALRAQAR